MADLLTNLSLDAGSVKCHSAMDLLVGKTGDLALTKSSQQALRQRFVLYLGTPKGERLDPDIGNSMLDFLHEINSINNTRKLELYLENDIRDQFKELNAKYVICRPSPSFAGEMEARIILGNEDLQFLFSSEDLMNISSMISEILYYAN